LWEQRLDFQRGSAASCMGVGAINTLFEHIFNKSFLKDFKMFNSYEDQDLSEKNKF
jgi:hypothetical protein